MTEDAKRVVLFGYHDVGCRVLETLQDVGAHVVGVITHTDDPAEEVWFGSVRELAESRGVPVLRSDSPNTEAVLQQVASWQPDYLLSAYYRRLLGAELLATPRHAALNVHGSLLPRYRGRAPVNWVLVRGETETGVTLHHMTEQADAGDIVAQERIAIAETDTALTLFSKVTDAAGALIRKTWPELARGVVVRAPQDASQATTFGRRTPEDGRIDWCSGARDVYNLVRAVTHPYPGAFTTFRGKRLLVWWATSRNTPADPKSEPPEPGSPEPGSPEPGSPEPGSPEPGSPEPGSVVTADEPTSITVQTGDGLLLLERVEYEGVESSGGDFAARHDVRRGERLG